MTDADFLDSAGKTYPASASKLHPSVLSSGTLGLELEVKVNDFYRRT